MCVYMYIHRENIKTHIVIIHARFKKVVFILR